MGRFFRQTQVFLLASVVTLLFMSGCGEQHPHAPLGSNPDAAKNTANLNKSVTTDTRVARHSILDQSLMLVEDLSTSQLVKASTGGTLYFGEFKFYIPPGSLAKDTIISIAMTSDKYIQMDFGPDGTQFNPPATMTVNYAKANLDKISPLKLSISWFDTATNQWINLGGTVNQGTLSVSVPVSHFTEYSLSTR